MDIRPFRGLRPRADLASRIPSLPYDVVDDAEARALTAGDPWSFLRVVRAEVDLDPSVDPHDPRVYERARANLDGMIERGELVQDELESFYVYRLERQGHAQTGVVGLASIADYREGRIRRHELTRPEKEDDRVRHTMALGAQPGMVYLMHRPARAVTDAVGRATARPPDVDFVAADGVRHVLWVVADARQRDAIAGALARLPAAYIADGHHRAAAYARAGEERGEATMLCALFPTDQVRILDYNRVVRDLAGLDRGSFLQRVRAQGFELVPGDPRGNPLVPRTFGVYLGGGPWQVLRAPDGMVPPADLVAALDVAILERHLLAPVLHVHDVRTDPRIDFVGGARGLAELERRVDRGGWAVAFALSPTRVEDVLAVSDAGREMPPKSTWFEPKLRSGMVVSLLRPATVGISRA